MFNFIVPHQPNQKPLKFLVRLGKKCFKVIQILSPLVGLVRSFKLLWELYRNLDAWLNLSGGWAIPSAWPPMPEDRSPTAPWLLGGERERATLPPRGCIGCGLSGDCYSVKQKHLLSWTYRADIFSRNLCSWGTGKTNCLVRDVVFSPKILVDITTANAIAGTVARTFTFGDRFSFPIEISPESKFGSLAFE